ncbi:MAG TPA: amino acid adenylation domain-containing protein [Streptosporangiaceae bacterium]|nr:amino acid adenylation domain-containing protein [Streptosporangiaceae bacterium]
MDAREFPVSPVQARLLLLDRMRPGSAHYNEPVAFAVHGPFDADAFQASLDTVIARHDALRTVFRLGGDGYRQVIADPASVRASAAGYLRVERDVSAAGVDKLIRAEAARPFDVERGPLLRCVIYAVDDGGHRVQFTVHHLVCDGWSMRLLLDELAAGYRAAREGSPYTPEPVPIQYPEYAAGQSHRLASGGYAESIAHWADSLRGAPQLLALPADLPRPAVQTTAGAIETVVLPATTHHRFIQLTRQYGVTPFMAAFASFAVFLGRICRQRDLIVGVPVSGREDTDLHGTVGMLTNTLPLRVDLSGEPTFGDVLAQVRDRLLASWPYQDAPFEGIVDAVAAERTLSHDPLVQAMFSYDTTPIALDLAGARTERVALLVDAAKFDVVLYMERWGDELIAQFSYRTDLFAAETVRHWARAFRTLLDGLLDRPDVPVADVDLLPPGAWPVIVRGAASAAPERLVPDLIAERAAARPDATAVASGDAVLTYGELAGRADRLAATLRRAGVGPEAAVGLCLPRSVEMAVAVLAVLRAGGAYVPLDPANPPARLAFMASDAGARLVISDQPRDLGVPVAVLAPGAADLVVPDGVATAPSGAGAGPGNAAYIMYTSGSTGTPKGVVVEHRALANLATAVRGRFGVAAGDRVLQYGPVGFDVSVSDMFFAFAAGAELHLVGERERLGEELYARLRDSRITYVLLPPAAAMSLPHPPGALPDLRTFVVGGEACPAEFAARWATPGRRVVNAYGPTETTVIATAAEVRAGRPVTIGEPVPGMRAYVLDERLRPVPVGVTGEIYLAGAGLGRGYAGRPGLTAERFVADPFGPPGARMYRTGDLGRQNDDGVLGYLGRVDSQVKVRGFRIELGEIETVLAGHPAVAVAAAAVRGGDADRGLVAYVVPGAGPGPHAGPHAAPGAPPGAAELRAWLGERLPGYMVPDHVVVVPALPVTPSGKVDRARLPEPPATRPELGRPYVPPATPTERRVAAIWAGVLGLDQIGAHDNFFDLGGTSTRLLTVLDALRGNTDGDGDGDLTLVDLFRLPTVAAIASRLDGSPAPPGGGSTAAATDRRRDRREDVMARRRARRHGGGE